MNQEAPLNFPWHNHTSPYSIKTTSTVRDTPVEILSQKSHWVILSHAWGYNMEREDHAIALSSLEEEQDENTMQKLSHSTSFDSPEQITLHTIPLALARP